MSEYRATESGEQISTHYIQMSGQLHALVCFTPVKEPKVHIWQEASWWVPAASECGGDENNTAPCVH